MPKETLDKLNKKAAKLRNVADSLILVIDPDFKNVSILLRKYCVVKYVETVAKYNSLVDYNSNHYGSLINYVSTLEDIVNNLQDLLEKSGPKKTINILNFVDVTNEVINSDEKTKKLK